MNKLQLLFLPLIYILIFSGCENALDVKQFLSVYEKQGMINVVKKGINISILYQSPEYLAANEFSSSKKAADFNQKRVRYENGYYFKLTFRNSDPNQNTGQFEDALLTSKLAQGQNHFNNQLKFLKNNIASHVYLETPSGEKVTPITHQHIRNFGMSPLNSFLFVFPKKTGTASVNLAECKIILKDIGFNMGTLKEKVKVPTGIKVKV